MLSGPASGLVAATRVARSLGRAGIITVDLGGTSCDLALNQGEEPEYATSTRVGDYPLVVPVVNVRAKGPARRGAAPGEFALMAFGGAGPTHANLLAEEAGLDTVVVPPGPATFCALGRDASIPGPAIIEQEDCTVWVLPGWNAAVHRTGSILIRRSDESGG